MIFDADGQLIVPLNEWHRLMEGVGAARTRETYLAVLRPWIGFLPTESTRACADSNSVLKKSSPVSGFPCRRVHLR